MEEFLVHFKYKASIIFMNNNRIVKIETSGHLVLNSKALHVYQVKIYIKFCTAFYKNNYL